MHPEIADVLAGRRRWCVPVGDCRAVLASMPDGSARCCVTSPPYWGLRDYGVDGQLGLEPTPEEYVASMVVVFREVRRVLADDGTLWLNLGDSYTTTSRGGESSTYKTADDKRAAMSAAIFGADVRRVSIPNGLKPKDLVGIPWRVAFALQADGWWLRQDIIWAKPNPMPESVTDRCTKAHEYVFLLAKSGSPKIWRARDTGEWSHTPDSSERIPAPTDDDPSATVARWRGCDYFYDADAIAEKMTTAGVPNSPESIKSPHGQGFTRRAQMPPIGGVKHADAVGGTYSGEEREWPDKRNARSVWSISPKPFHEAHFATMPEALADRCVRAGSEVGDLVIDPFNGAGTTGLVSVKHGRRYVGPELNPAYADIARRRIAEADTHLFTEAMA